MNRFQITLGKPVPVGPVVLPDKIPVELTQPRDDLYYRTHHNPHAQPTPLGLSELQYSLQQEWRRANEQQVYNHQFQTDLGDTVRITSHDRHRCEYIAEQTYRMMMRDGIYHGDLFRSTHH